MRRISVAAYLLLAACAAGPPQEDPHPTVLTSEDKSGDPVPAIRRLIDHPEEPGNLDHAAAIADWHLRDHPDRADLHLLAAEAHARACEHADASSPDHRRHRTEGLAHAEAALKARPDDGAAHYWLAAMQLHAADAERSLGRAKEALKHLDKADALSPKIDDAGPSRMRGRVLADMPGLFGGSVPKAVASYKRSLELAPEVITTHLWLGEAYAGAGKTDLARHEFEWVVAAKPRPGREKEDAESRKKAQEELQKLPSK